MKRSSKRFLLFFVVSFLICLINFQPAFKEKIAEFGFTPYYVDVAETSLKTGSYSSTLPYLLMHQVDSLIDPSQTITEVQREPFYPLLLILTKLAGFDYWILVYVQFFVLILIIAYFANLVWEFLGKRESLLFCLLIPFSTILFFYSNVLYPFIFQIGFLLLFFIFFLKGLHYHHPGWYLLSGLFLGLSMYERNAYLLLPLFVVFVFFLLRKKYKISLQNLGLFLLMSYFVITPWVIRNYQQGFVGMNQILGYCLGYNYGSLETKPEHITSQSKHYDQWVAGYGTDTGSLYAVADQVVSGGYTFSQADNIVRDVVWRKMKDNPKDALIRAMKDYLYFSNHLIGQPGKFLPGKEISIPYYFKYIAQLQKVHWVHPVFFGLIIIYLLVLIFRKWRPFDVLSGVVLLYFLCVFTPIVGDPRYRGFIELLIYGYGAALIVDIWIRLRNKIS